MSSLLKASAALLIVLLPQALTSAEGYKLDAGWLVEGAYVEYSGNVTYVTRFGASTSDGSMRWEIVEITPEGEALVNMTLTILRDGFSTFSLIKLDLENNTVLEIDGRRVFNVTNHLWINREMEVGDLYQLENLTAKVVDVKKYNLTGVELECYVLNVTFHVANMTGYIERSYDMETGILVYTEFHIKYLGEKGEVLYEYRSVILAKDSNILKLAAEKRLLWTSMLCLTLAAVAASLVYVIVRKPYL